MKWALSQLFKYNGKPFTFEGEYDFSDRIDSIDDILAISTVKVEGVGRNLYKDRYAFDMHITTTLTLEDAVTLDPIEFPVELHVTELYDVVDDGEVNLIEKNTVDLEQVVWELVYLEKPMRITNTQ